MKYLAFFILLAGCTSVGQTQSRSDEDMSIIRVALADVLSGGYVMSKGQETLVAVCFPTLVDPPKGFLGSMGRPNLFPCSALTSTDPSSPRTLRKTGQRVTQCSISSVQFDADHEHSIVEGNCASEPVSGGGFLVTLERTADGWKVLKGRGTWSG